MAEAIAGGAAAIILAAGAGTRMKSDLPKVAHECDGKPMVRWVIEAAHAAGIERIVSVIGHGRDVVAPLVADTCVAIQEQQRGTADAVASAREALAGFEGSVVVLSGDCPLITAETIRELIAMREREQAAVVVLSMRMDDPFGYGRIVRDGAGALECIVEQKDATPEQAAITECNSGFYCFDAQALFAALSQVGSNNAQGEFYLTDVIGICREAGRTVCAWCTPDATECLGVNTPEQLACATQEMRKRIQR